jgi:hypothetical protein
MTFEERKKFLQITVATTSAELMTLNTQCEVDIFHMFTMVGSLSPLDFELSVITHYYVPFPPSYTTITDSIIFRNMQLRVSPA